MKKRILIVDDDIMTLKILKKSLEDDFDVITENAGYRFVEKMESYDADLIILDVEMPVVNGLDAFDEVIRNPRMRDVPVAFLSGVSNPNLVRKVMQKGAVGYIVKTTPVDEIVARINDFLNKSSERKSQAEVMILHADLDALKIMRDTLADNGYKVKIVKNMVEAAEYMKKHHPQLFLIGHDSAGVSPGGIYESLSSVMYNEGVVGVLMEKQLFSQELLDIVSKALGD